MDGWDIALLSIMGYLAILALVRQMLARRDSLLAEFRIQIEAERRKQKQQAAVERPKAR